MTDYSDKTVGELYMMLHPEADGAQLHEFMSSVGLGSVPYSSNDKFHYSHTYKAVHENLVKKLNAKNNIMTKAVFKELYYKQYPDHMVWQNFDKDLDRLILQPEPQSLVGYQLCPKCGGSGIFNHALSSSATTPCDVCNGKKIISMLTGLPPFNRTEFKPAEDWIDPIKPAEQDLADFAKSFSEKIEKKPVYPEGILEPDKTFNYYRCPYCGWVTELGSSSCVDECERCNPTVKDNLDVLITDAADALSEQFFAKDGWLKPLNRQVYLRVGKNHFRFDLSYVYEENQFTVPPRQNTNPIIDHMQGLQTEKVEPIKSGDYRSAPNEKFGARHTIKPGAIFTVQEIEKAIGELALNFNYSNDWIGGFKTVGWKDFADKLKQKLNLK